MKLAENEKCGRVSVKVFRKKSHLDPIRKMDLFSGFLTSIFTIVRHGVR